MADDTSTAESARRRIEQIVRTAHRAMPTDVGRWALHTGRSSPAEAVVIAPADFRWLIEQASTPPAKSGHTCGLELEALYVGQRDPACAGCRAIPKPCCPGAGSMAHVRGCINHPEADRG